MHDTVVGLTRTTLLYTHKPPGSLKGGEWVAAFFPAMARIPLIGPALSRRTHVISHERQASYAVTRVTRITFKKKLRHRQQKGRLIIQYSNSTSVRLELDTAVATSSGSTLGNIHRPFSSAITLLLDGTNYRCTAGRSQSMRTPIWSWFNALTLACCLSLHSYLSEYGNLPCYGLLQC